MGGGVGGGGGVFSLICCGGYIQTVIQYHTLNIVLHGSHLKIFYISEYVSSL